MIYISSLHPPASVLTSKVDCQEFVTTGTRGGTSFSRVSSGPTRTAKRVIKDFISFTFDF